MVGSLCIWIQYQMFVTVVSSPSFCSVSDWISSMLRSEHVCHYFLVSDWTLVVPVKTFIFIEKPITASMIIFSLFNLKQWRSWIMLHFTSVKQRILWLSPLGYSYCVNSVHKSFFITVSPVMAYLHRRTWNRSGTHSDSDSKLDGYILLCRPFHIAQARTRIPTPCFA